jgi:hypothetical protein
MRGALMLDLQACKTYVDTPQGGFQCSIIAGLTGGDRRRRIGWTVFSFFYLAVSIITTS